jgi:hypothetical protein
MCLDGKVTNSLQQARLYLDELDPIVWIPSNVWFTFQGRRVAELGNVQKTLYERTVRAPNYGLLTMVLTHMLQHVGITPVMNDQSLGHALKGLRFEEISQRFGCFFLHNLDVLTGRLTSIDEEDSERLLRKLNGKKAALNRNQHLSGTGEVPSARAITWKALRDSVNGARNSRATINPFVWKPGFLRNSAVEHLFRAFTTQFWMLLTDSGFTPLTTPPTTLREAMELWSLESIGKRVKADKKVTLIPSSDRLHGFVPAKFKEVQFVLLRERFFPEPGTDVHPSSGWAALFKKGYVRDFHQAIEESRDEGELLRETLDKVFTELHVLPYNPGHPSKSTPLWRWDHSDVKMLVNSSYVCLLDRVLRQGGGEERGEGHKKLLSNQQMESKLDGAGPSIRVKNSSDRRSGKSKNQRKPPKKRQKVQ